MSPEIWAGGERESSLRVQSERVGGAHVRQIRDQNAAGTPYWQALCILSPNRRRFRILRWRDNRKRCSDQTATARRNRAPNLGTYRRSVRWDAGAVKFRVVCAQAYKLSPSSRSRAISISFCTALPMATSSARRSQTATVNLCLLCRGSSSSSSLFTLNR